MVTHTPTRMLVAAVIIVFLIDIYKLQLSLALNCEIHCKSHFNISLFTGIWYQQAKFGSKLFGGIDKCGLVKFSQKKNQIDVNYSSTSVLDNDKINYTGKAVYRYSNKKNGILIISWRFDPEYRQEAVTRLYIVGTNYNDFAVIASVKKKKNVSGWVITRQRNLTIASNFSSIISKINKSMGKIEKVVNTSVKLDAQTNCDSL